MQEGFVHGQFLQDWGVRGSMFFHQLLLQDESGENEREGGTGGGDRTDYGYGTYLQGTIEGEVSQCGA